MSIRTILVVLLAVMFGLSAAWGVNQLRRPVVVEGKADTTPIVVAALDIPRGQMLQETDVVLRDWPKDSLPEGAITNMADAVSRSASYPFLAGDPIVERKLASAGSGRGLASLVPTGMRAYTIQSSKVAATVAGFILPGNRVDVLLNVRRGGSADETGGGFTITLLQSVEILAVDQNLDAPAENKNNPIDLQSVTLLVTPKQATLLDLGQNAGVLSLSLRNPEDKDEADTDPALLADVLSQQQAPVDPPEVSKEPIDEPKEEKKQPDVFQIVTLRGSQRGSVQVVKP